MQNIHETLRMQNVHEDRPQNVCYENINSLCESWQMYLGMLLLTDFAAAELCYGLSSIHRRNVHGQSDSCWSALVLLAY